MNYDQIKTIVEEAIKNGASLDWWVYILIIVFSATGGFLGAYLKKKAENLATKEDIEAITKKVEDVRSEYSKQLELHKATLQLSNQLKLAALDKRLEKHQEAFTLWRSLLFSIRDEDKIGIAIDESQRWWEKNCLYLSDEARSAFHTAFILAVDFRNLPRTDPETIKEWFDKINEAGKKIVEAVNLPPLSEDKIKPINQNSKS
jgi:hypothetical protein